MNRRDFYLGLSLINGVGPILALRIAKRYPSRDLLISAPLEEVTAIEGVRSDTARNILSFNWDIEVQQEKEKAERCGVDIVTIEDAGYPARLREIYAPPVILYKKGEFKDDDRISIAIVGSRLPTPYGRTMTERLAKGLAERGVTVVSGFARGIDTIAHTSSLKSGGRTIAVLGSGLDIIYPSENRELAKEIIKNGAIISEFPMGCQPERMNFPRRNRIISGLTTGTIVVEAAEKSGAIITANYALEQGRDVFAVPGPVSSAKSRGTNRLIKMGAKLVEDADDVIEEFSASLKISLEGKKGERRENIELTDEEKNLYNFIPDDGIDIDNLIEVSNLPAGRVSAILLKLEIKGLVRKMSGSIFKS
ncbi:MAG: DNA-processing protein DprA [Nitrospinota bacterium]|nr:DNA-processing protein DprA [Nitrospinota bacterium]